jgi:hypothetical protein
MMLPRPSTPPMPTASAVLTPVPPDPTPESSPPAAAVDEPSDAPDPSAEPVPPDPLVPSAVLVPSADVDPPADAEVPSPEAMLERPRNAVFDEAPLAPTGAKLPPSLPPPHESSRVIDAAIRHLRTRLFFIFFPYCATWGTPDPGAAGSVDSAS